MFILCDRTRVALRVSKLRAAKKYREMARFLGAGVDRQRAARTPLRAGLTRGLPRATQWPFELCTLSGVSVNNGEAQRLRRKGFARLLDRFGTPPWASGRRGPDRRGARGAIHGSSRPPLRAPCGLQLGLVSL